MPLRPCASSLLQSTTETDCHRQAGSDSPGVWSPSAHPVLEARSTRVCLARHLPTTGFLALLPVSFFQNLPALFHAGALMGFSLQGFSPSQSPSSSRNRSPSWRSLRDCRPCGRAQKTFHRKAPPSRLCSLRGSEHLLNWGEPIQVAAALLGFPAFREFPLAIALHSRVGSPLELSWSPELRTSLGS